MSFKRNKKLLFIHSPKTGGDFVRKNLRKYTYTSDDFTDRRKHEPFSQYTDQSYTPWSITRDPYDRLESMYFFQMYEKRDEVGLIAPTFEQYILRKCFYGPIDPHSRERKTRKHRLLHKAEQALRVVPQVDFLRDISKENLLRFERLVPDLEWFFNVVHGADIDFTNEKWGKPINMSILKPSDRNRWTPQMRKVVNKYFKHDFREFNYKIR